VSNRVAALIVAAGAGTRFGGALPKVFVPLGGAPLLAWSLRAFGQHPEISTIVVVVAAEYLEQTQELCAAELDLPYEVVAGGSQRRNSVANGLRALSNFNPNLVAIHDGARPLVSAPVISDSLRVARTCGAALATLGVTDTVKQLAADGCILATLDREQLQLAQTPQTFNYELILRAHERAEAEGWEVTDDAMLVERLGHPVYASQGEWRNLKITRPEDLMLAEWLLQADRPRQRIGHGFDLHRLVEGRKLMLGGVEIPHEKGLLGHSDADAALHALCDAILGAAGLGDIGQHFPDTDPAYKDADSLDLTRRVAELARAVGWQVGNVDVTIIAQQPRLAPHIPAMREATAAALGIAPALVNFKATTTEKLGLIGEGQALAAEAVALLVPVSPS
jgi:2-C-methyl-D-erythritol 4-phosphate cytidylyltransferase/2-C-methyl-D-erythritol 2,4-cyclodiphosphate synthase